MRGKRSIGIGYIIAPTGDGFGEYIQTCYKTKTVSIVTEDSEIYHQVKMGASLFSQVRFPDQERKEIMGSIVIYIRGRDTSIPTIVSTLELADSGDDLLPEQWRVTSRTNSSSMSFIQGDTREGTIDIITSSQSGGALINIRASSKTKDSIIKIESDGEVLVMADSVCKVNAREKIQLGEDEKTEFTLLGEKWKSFMEEFFQKLGELNISIPPGVVSGGSVTFATPGVVGPDSKLAFKDLISKLDSVLATLVEVQ